MTKKIKLTPIQETIKKYGLDTKKYQVDYSKKPRKFVPKPKSDKSE